MNCTRYLSTDPVTFLRPTRKCSIVLLGETGAGKSSVVNALSLMSRQVRVDDMPCVFPNTVHDDDWGETLLSSTVVDPDENSTQNVRTFLEDTFSHCVIPSQLTRDLNLVVSENEHNESLITGASQTLKPKIFEFIFARAEYDFHLKVIDTPGLGDTRGHNQDEQNIDMILEHLCSVDDLGGIVLVMNGTVSRVNASVVNVINKLKSILPVCIFETCFYILFTNTDLCGSNYNIDWLFPEPDQKPKVSTFHINNNLFSLSVDQWKLVTPVDKSRLIENWRSTNHTLKRLLVTAQLNADNLTPAYREMRQAHMEFLETFAATQSSIRNILEKCRAISVLVHNLRNTHNSTASEIEQELKKQTVQIVKFTTGQYYSTFCVDHVFTGLVCHAECGLTETLFSGDPDSWSGADVFFKCSAFDNGVCNMCPQKKCTPNLHFHSYEHPTLVDVPIVNMQDDIFSEYLGSWKDRDMIDNYKDAIVCMRDSLLNQINTLFTKALQLKHKVYYFDFKKYLQSALDVLRLELNTTSLAEDVANHDRLIQLCEVYSILLSTVDQTKLAPITSLRIPLIEGVLKIDKNNFLDENLIKQLEDLKQNANNIVNGIDQTSVPASFVKLYQKYKGGNNPTPPQEAPEPVAPQEAPEPVAPQEAPEPVVAKAKATTDPETIEGNIKRLRRSRRPK